MTDESLGICHFRFGSTDLNILLNVSLQSCVHADPLSAVEEEGGGKLSLETGNLLSYQFPL